MADSSNTQTQGSSRLGRVVIYTLLGLVCLYYLMPLFIMVSTSLKTLDDIRTGNLVSLPAHVTFQPWQDAWGNACIGVRCEGMSVYFWNSFRFVVPAVLISTLVGAFNGYVFTMWRFRGSDIFFSALMTMALRFFDPMTAPRPQRPAKLCWSKAMQAIATRRSPAGPMAATLILASPAACRTASTVSTVSLPHRPEASRICT